MRQLETKIRLEQIPGADNNYDPDTNPDIRDVTEPPPDAIDVTDPGSREDVQEVYDYPRTSQMQTVGLGMREAWKLATKEDQEKAIKRDLPGVLEGEKTPSGQDIPKEEHPPEADKDYYQGALGQWKHAIPVPPEMENVQPMATVDKTPRQEWNEILEELRDKFPLPYIEISRKGKKIKAYDKDQLLKWGKRRGLSLADTPPPPPNDAGDDIQEIIDESDQGDRVTEWNEGDQQESPGHA